MVKVKSQTLKKSIVSFAFACVPSILLGVTTCSAWAQSQKDIELQIGILQRFGSKPTDKLTIKATNGDRLTLSFSESDGQPKTLQATEVKLEIQMQPLATPMLEERLVLGNYRSYEDAEETANQWRTKGIEVEIAQPDDWQVWAKREIYSTPLLRRLLLASLQSQGYATAYLETKVLQQKPQASWAIDGSRYSLDWLEVTAGRNTIQIKEGKEDKNNEKDNKPARLYEGSLRLQPNAYGTYTLVNQVALETYLRGVVPYEIGSDSPYASQEAQAIIARTYVLRNLRRFAIDNYQLCADTQCQVYKGITETWPQVDRAIAATAGQVLTYQNELVDALYSSATGGVTAPFGDVWRGAERPYLQAVVDSTQNVWNLSIDSLADEQNFRRFISLKKGFNEEDWDLFRWREESSLAQMNKDLKKYLQEKKHPLANFKTIQQLRVVERSPAGRVLKLEVQTDREAIVLERDEIFKGFYAPLSTFFYVEPIVEPDKTLWGYAFIGGGFGHGVGLSQSGSYKLADLGWSSDRILSFYYPGTELQRLRDSITFWRDPLTSTIQQSLKN